MHLRVTKRRRSEVSIYDPIGHDREGNEIMLIDVLESEPNVIPDQVVAREEVELLHKELRILAPKERKVLVLRFGLRYAPRKTQREIARMLGISRSYVRIPGQAEHEFQCKPNADSRARRTRSAPDNGRPRTLRPEPRG